MGSAHGLNLTPQQRLAVETRDVSIALSAGAGCGKTHVLVARYLSHLAGVEGPPARGVRANRAKSPAATTAETFTTEAAGADALSGLIAITFTDRAAREMRDRVRRVCRQRLKESETEAEADRWLALLRELETARISTIHSFCGSLLRAHAVEARLDPRFEILQPAQAATLFSELLDDQLRQQLAAATEELIDLAVKFKLSALRDMIQHLSRQAVDFERWENVRPEELFALWKAFESEHVVPQLVNEFLQLPEVKEIQALIRTVAPAHETMKERFAALAYLLPRLNESDAPLEDLTQFRDFARVQGGGTAKHWPSEAEYHGFKDAAKAAREWIDSNVKGFGVKESEALASAKAGLEILRVARPVIQAYQERKRELGVLDFDDLLVRARDLLTGPHAKTLQKQISSGLTLLLVDEFQDTDPLQVELVKLLCGERLLDGKLFFVGDSKQSIYRFRGADPRVFRELQAEIPKRGRLPLTLNFRSQRPILEFVNAMFCERLGPNYEALEASRDPLSAGPAVEFLWSKFEGEPGEKPNAEDLRLTDAEWIARRLKEIFASREKLVSDEKTKQSRPVEPGDVAILFRSLTSVQHYEAALRRYDIPYYLVGGRAFYSQQEVFDLLNLLRFLDCERDLVSLAGVLRSPFFSLVDETLFWLVQNGGDLATGLLRQAPPAQLSEEERQKTAFAAATLTHLCELKDRLPVAALVREALTRTGYDALLVAEFLGERKLANLRKLIDQARSFDQAGIFSLADFVNQLAEFVANQPQEPAAPVEPESSTVVRLMTIHQSKGLEFPLVIVPDLTRQPKGNTSSLAYDPELGPLVRAPAADGDKTACGLDLYRRVEKQEDAQEVVRLLYVAMTRAADYLVLTACADVRDEKFEAPSGSWLSLIAERYNLATGELIGAIPPHYARPQVRVTLDPPAASAPAVASGRVNLVDVASAARNVAIGKMKPSALVSPVAADEGARAFYSFSRLSGALRPVAEIETSGVWAEATGDDHPTEGAAELGTLVHSVMAQIDFSAKQPVDVMALVRREADRRFATPEQHVAAAIEMVSRFVRSDRAADFRKARALHRELEFLLAWPPGAGVSNQTGRNGATMPLRLQGFIDCLVQDERGAWSVVDFKTNRVAAGAVPQAAATYEPQMMLYALAVEEIMGQSPHSLTLHFMHPGVEHTFAWNAAARAKTIALISGALADITTGAKK
ncbi:MAG TPA: UvrD-helicase domain-containing protein [Pirellulales bacterium]|jgi:ATP-dependent helicase/nuclease subunit A